MDGRNSAGRKISLLNDSSDVAAANTTINFPHQHPHQHHSIPRIHPTKIQLPPINAHSRASSSCSTTPSLSPQTPQLSRSSSSDSRAFQTPSPVTPSFEPNFTTSHSAHYRFPHQLPRQHSSSSSTSQHPPLHLHHPHAPASAHKPQSAQHYYLLNNSSSGKMDESQLYPPLPDVASAQTLGFPIPQSITPQMPILAMQQAPIRRSSDSPSSEPSRVSAVSGTSTANNNNSGAKPQQPKKNQYPCPLAKQYNCSDFFTTSGHAARHAKKHTGKKDAYCPECNKAFTRKDNMEQHRRTHQNGRGGSRATNANNDDAKVKKSTKHSSKKINPKVEPQLEAAVTQELAEQQAVAAQAQAQAAAAQAQVHAAQQQAQQQVQPQHIEPALMMPVSGPYFLGGAIDTGPVPPLPMAMPELGVRPPLHRTTLSSSLDFMPPTAPMALTDDALHYSYPSPGLSNGLNSLALAASEHQRRLSEEKTQSQSPSSETPTPP